MGGARAGRPNGSRRATTAVGSVTSARILSRPPHGQASTSSRTTRRRSEAQSMRAYGCGTIPMPRLVRGAVATPGDGGRGDVLGPVVLRQERRGWKVPAKLLLDIVRQVFAALLSHGRQKRLLMFAHEQMERGPPRRVARVGSRRRSGRTRRGSDRHGQAPTPDAGQPINAAISAITTCVSPGGAMAVAPASRAIRPLRANVSPGSTSVRSQHGQRWARLRVPNHEVLGELTGMANAWLHEHVGGAIEIETCACAGGSLWDRRIRG